MYSDCILDFKIIWIVVLLSGSSFEVRGRPSSNMTIHRFPVDFKSVASHIRGNRRQSFNLFQVDFKSLASHILVKLVRFVYTTGADV
jgi:hypothetical protein